MFSKKNGYASIRATLLLAMFIGLAGIYPAQAESMDVGWVQGWGGSNMDYGTAIAIDSNGNVFSTGFTRVALSNDDIVITKLDVDGNYAWSHVISGASYDNGRTISTDTDGNVYVAGMFSGTVDFDPGLGVSEWTSLGQGDIFVLKLDSDGNFIWCKSLGGTGSDAGNALVAAGEYFFLLGFYSETVDFDPGTGENNLTSQGSSDVFISKLDNDGNFIWTKSFGGASYDNSFDIEVDGNGDLLLTGYVSGTADLDPGTGVSTFTGAAGNNFFISKLDSNGDLIWTRPGGVMPNAAGIELALDQNGASHVTGYHTLAGSNNIFVMKVDADGNPLWFNNMGGTGYDTGYGIAVDEGGNVFTTGDFADTVDFDPGPSTSNLTSAGVGDVFISKLDANGDFVWAKRLGGTGSDGGEGIAIDSNGRVYLMGWYSDTVDFDLGTGTHNLTSAGNFDIFFSKLVLTPQIYYVDQNANGANDGTSWADAFTDLQSALAAASNGDEIWVALGTYKPTTGTDRTISFHLKNGVAIYGGFAGTETLLSQRNYETNVTILSGDIGIVGEKSDNSYHVVVGNNITGSTVLDGFTITAGNANGSNGGYSDGGAMNNTYSNPALRNLVIDKNSGGIGSGVINFNSSPTFTNVIFSNNTGLPGGRGGALVNDANSSPNLTNVTFFNNTVDWLGAAMSNSYDSNPYLVNVTFVDNSVYNATNARGGAIYNWDSNPTLINVTITGNSADAGGAIYNDNGSQTTIMNSILYGNEGGEIYNNSGTSTVSYSIVQGGYSGAGNLDVNPLLGPLQDNGSFTQTMALSAGSPAIDAGSDENCPDVDQRGMLRPQHDHCDIGAFEFGPQIRRVQWNATGTNNGTSWADAFVDLQSALTAASGGDEIWVAAGTYKPTSGTDRTVSFTLKNGVAVYGGFAGTEALLSQRNYETNVTILSGDIGTQGDASDNSYHVVVGSNTDASAILDGFTITYGNANTLDAGVAHEGGGVYNTSGSPTLSNLIFSNNSAVWGGGMANDNDSSPTLKNITFSGNTTVSPTTLPPSGGGIYNSASSPSLENVTFYNNSAEGGGGIFNHFGSSPTLVNVTFSANTAEYGSAIMSRDLDSHPILTNVTMHGNSATYSVIDGGTIATMGSLTIKNSILWGNSGGSIANVGPETPQVSYSIVEGGAVGTGNLDVDPVLGPLQNNGGFTQTMALGEGSPAIDAANDADCPDTDQRGVDRPQGAGCDIGAYEYVFSPIPTDTPAATATHTATATSTATVTPTSTATPTRTPTLQPVAKPGIPVLVSPANGALVASLSPDLDWKDSNPLAHHYQVQVSTNSAFTALVINKDDVLDSTFTPTLLPGKLYSWRVRAFNLNGVASGWSSVRMFKTPLSQPTLVSPADDVSLLTDRPTFEWDAVPSATTYVLQVSRVENFSTLLVNATINANKYSMPKDLPVNKTLHWRVRARTSAVTGSWSTTSSFTTGNPPSVPVLSSPANGVLVRDYTPRFNWKDSTGASVQQYEIEVDEERDFSSPLIETTSPISEFTPSLDLASNTQFFWRVRSVNFDGHTSGWSPVWSLRTVIAKPGSLTMIPNVENPLRPGFEWDDATGTGTITGYTIQVSTRADFNTLLLNGTTKMSVYAMLKDLPAGKTIYWRVRVNGPNGASAWTTEQFTIPNP